MLQKILSISLVLSLCLSMTIIVSSQDKATEELYVTDTEIVTDEEVTTSSGVQMLPNGSFRSAGNTEYVERLLHVSDEVLALPTEALFEHFMASEYMENSLVSNLSTFNPKPRDFTWHEAYCELIDRTDFLDAVEAYVEVGLPIAETDRTVALKLCNLLAQPTVNSLFEDAYAAGESYPALQQYYHPTN